MTIPSQSPDVAKRLDRMLHMVLMAGLAGSVVIIGIGLILSIVHKDVAVIHPDISTVISKTDLPAGDNRGYGAIWSKLHRGTADGFLNLGILILIATPVLRVVGSLIDFLRIHDWRFAAITLLVLVILTIGILSDI